MIKHITSKDWKIILHLTGSIIYFFGFSLLFPLIVAICVKEYNSAINFMIGFLVCFMFGFSLRTFFILEKDCEWIHGMSATTISWLLAMFIGAIPYYLSGFYKSYLDSCFDVMSGLTSTGLILIQNLDHLPISLNLWRHILSFIGGQGIVVIALALLPPIGGLGFKALVGEAKEERLMPSIRETGKIIWYISFYYFFIFSLVLYFVGLTMGFNSLWSIFHSVCIFMTSWSTGGFAPQSQNFIYYHNFYIEIISMIVMILGSMNFGLHYFVWFKKKNEIIKDIEIKSMTITITLTSILLFYGLIKNKIYMLLLPLIRRGLFILISGHTGTGASTIYSIQFVNNWGNIGLIALILAMAFGGSSTSTSGGFKGIRIGILFKAIIIEIKKFFLPSGAVIIEKFNHLEENILTDKIVKSSAIIILLYIIMHLAGTIVGVLNGYSPMQALFESVSAGANVGLSCGITSASMPVSLKITYIMNMWLGRLEFIAVFVFTFLIIRYFSISKLSSKLSKNGKVK